MQPLNKAHWRSAAACASWFHSNTAGADPAVSVVGLHRLHHGAQLAEPGAFGGFVKFWRGFISGAIN